MISSAIIQGGRAVFLFVLVCFCAWGQWSPQAGCPPGGEPGRWSKMATDLVASTDFRCADERMRDLRVYSPDHRSAVHIVGDRWSVEIGKEKLSLEAKASHVGYPADLEWAPDDATFYITQVEERSGAFYTEIYRVQEEQIDQVLGATKAAYEDFDHEYGCIVDESGKPKRYGSNVAGFKWIDGSGQLLLILEVPPSNICRHPGYYQGYLVSILNRKIVARYSPQELKRSWEQILGERLNYDYSLITETGVQR